MTASSNATDTKKLTTEEYKDMRENDPERLGLPPKPKFKDSGRRTEFGICDRDPKKLTIEEYKDMRENDPERLGLPPNPKFKDSGRRTEFETGAVRDAQEGKGRMDLLPPRALFEVAKVFEEGAKKYFSRNWEKGIPLSRFFDSGMRHAYKYLRGDRDEPHDAMACWNFMCLVETRMRIEEGLLPESLNDLPFNPLDIKSNPLGIKESNTDSGLIQFVDRVMEELGNEPK